MRLLFTVLFTFIISLNNVALAQETKEGLTKVGDQFMTLLLKGDTEKAYKDLLAASGGGSERLKKQGTGVADFMQKVRMQLGEPIAFDLISTQSIKEHFFKQKYLLKFDNAAIVWEINYYQPTKGWKLVDIAYNTDIDALFEKQGTD